MGRDPVRHPVVGIAGKCCAGKDQVAAILLDRGYREINVDKIGHRALAVKRNAVVDAFGTGILGEDGQIDRRILGSIVFADRSQRKRLEAIFHPWMREQVRLEVQAFRNRESRAAGMIEATGADESAPEAPQNGDFFHTNLPRGLLINAALLFTMHLDLFCDHLVWVEAPLFLRVMRGLNRDDHGFLYLLRRMLSQRRIASQEQLSRADIIRVRNASTVVSLEQQLRRRPELRIDEEHVSGTWNTTRS